MKSLWAVILMGILVGAAQADHDHHTHGEHEHHDHAAHHGHASHHAGQAQAHVHGRADLQVVLEGRELTLILQMPLQSLLGFERPPQTEQEQTRLGLAKQALAQSDLWQLPSAAGCALEKEVLTWPEWGAESGHYALSVQWHFICATPSALTELRHGVFAAAVALEQLDVVVIAEHRQWATSLTAANPVLVFD